MAAIRISLAEQRAIESILLTAQHEARCAANDPSEEELSPWDPLYDEHMCTCSLGNSLAAIGSIRVPKTAAAQPPKEK